MRLKTGSITKISLLLFLLSVIFIAACSGSAAPPTTSEQTNSATVFSPECPNGIVNEQFPGTCGKYVDRNSDGICDLSQ
jgi:hypothetical protein